MPSQQSPNPPEWAFKLGNTEAAVFQNEKDDRLWRSALVQRSHLDRESGTWIQQKANLLLRDVNNALRVLMLARKHLADPPIETTDKTPERAFQIGNVSTAVFRREQENRTTRETVFQRDYLDGEERKRQQIRFFQQEISNAIFVLEQARDYLEEQEAEVTDMRQKKTVAPKRKRGRKPKGD